MTVETWIAADHRLGESILWHVATARYFWIDLLDPALFDHDPATGVTRRRGLDLPPPIGSIAATDHPRLLMIAHRGGLALLDIETLALEPYCDPEGGRDGIIYNDMKCDRFGRLWAGTSHERETEPRGALWCVKDRTSWALGDAGFPISNGPAFAPDGRTMYFNDSAGRQTLAYDIDAQDLLPRHRRVLRTYAEAEGLPDGATVDAAGNIWTAQWNGARIMQLAPGGDMLASFDVAAWNVTALCFGGDGFRTITITSARDGVSDGMMARYPLTGSLFRLRTGAAGLPEPLFRL